MQRTVAVRAGGERRAFSKLGPACALAGLSALGAVLVAVLAGESELQRWQLAVRYTARVACLWFLAAYLARPLHTLAARPFTRAWQALRRPFGLAYASAMGVHLAAVVVYLAQGGRWPRLFSRAYLSLAVVMLIAMVVTSNLGVQRRLGSAWRRLHRVGMHLQWGAFAGAFAFSVPKHEYFAWPLLLLTLIAALLRGFASLQ
ncbi:MAG TPA: hypothetical protein VFK05_34800 [Polyangiaceae bacterium]|nr:hypothetical protein [Polyangiaceae bacterium]